jgi:hypothetical protein
MIDPDVWGLLPASEGWQEWFAWHPVMACDRWRWLERVQRRRDPGDRFPFSYWKKTLPWEYRAGRAHDYPDSEENHPMHFYTYTCKHCGARFGI